MKIIVDLELCQGHGQCEDSAPEVFRVNDAGLVDILNDSPGEELRAQVEEAARRCPVEAITIEG